MSTKNLLHWTKVPQFSTFMIKKGYIKMKVRGSFEVARFYNPNIIGQQKTVLIFDKSYKHKDSEHVTVQGKDYSLLKEFLHENITSSRNKT